MASFLRCLGLPRKAISALCLLFALVAVALANVDATEPAYDLAVPKGVEVSSLFFPPNLSGAPQSVPFDVDPDGLPIVAEGPVLRLLGSSKQLLNLGVLTIDDFAWMRNGSLLFVTQGHLATFGGAGVTLSLALPSVGMRVRPAGENTAYVFGGSKEPGNHSIYLFARDGTITQFIVLPNPVADVAGDGAKSYVATGRTVLRIAKDQPITGVLQTVEDITSLALAPTGGLFYATKSGVGYVTSTGAAYEFMRGQTGLLRVRGSSLFVLMPEGPHLIRLGPVEAFEQVLRPPT